MAQPSSPSLLGKHDSVTLAQRLSDVEYKSHASMVPITGYQEFSLLPLHIAVQTLEDEGRVPMVLKNAKTAKQSVRDLSDGLTKDECAAIYLYTMEWHPEDQALARQMNTTLRTQDSKQVVPFFAYLKLFLTALSKLPPVATTVWRGVRDDLSHEYLTGTNFVWWGFSSCTESLDLLESEHFLGKSGKRTLFNIQCQSGKSIQAHSSFMGESEILLLPGTNFQVLGRVNPAPNLYIIHVKEIVPTNPHLQQPFHMPTTPSQLVNINAANQTSSLKEKQQSEKPKVPKRPSSATRTTREDVPPSNSSSTVTSLRQMFEKESSTAHKTAPILKRASSRNSRSTTSLEVPKCAPMKIQISEVSTPKITPEIRLVPDDEPHSNTSIRVDEEGRNDSQLPLHDNKDLADFIHAQRTDARVSFGNKNLTNEDAEIIISELMVNSDWKEVVLSGNLFSLQAASALADALASTSTITHLFLDSNQLSDAGTTRLAWALCLNETVIDLRLDFNTIADSGALELAAMLYLNATIEKLSLSGNAIGNKGMIAFSEALANNTTLLQLNLSSNRITDECLKDILRLLKRQESLGLLDLRDNQLSEESNSAILRMINRLDVLRGQSIYGVEKLVSEVNDQLEEISRLEDVFSHAITARVLIQSQLQTMEEEISFLKLKHEEEINTIDQQPMVIDVAAFYQAELTRAVTDIRNDYACLSKAQQFELDLYYRTKTEELHEELQAMENVPAAETFRQSLAELYKSLVEATETHTQLRNEYAIGLQRRRELQAILKDIKEKKEVMIDDQERQIQALKTSIIYLTDCYSRTKLRNAYLQAEMNTHRKLTQAK